MSKPEEFYTEEDEITFNILNPETVRKLEREGDITLPKKKVDVPKDMRWNTKQMASKLYQGILGGDSIPKIAKSLMDVIGNNKASAVRNARTMVTGAENAGRLDSYNDLAEQGVVQKKEWIATPDDRTRESHIAVDGEERDIDKPFSNGLMYPGDPSGAPAEVWNCRCSMGTHIVGFRKADGSVSKVDYTADRTLHEDQMQAEKERRGFEGKTQAVDDGIKYDKSFDDAKWVETKQLIDTLATEYTTRLEQVAHGAEKAAGAVDISGSVMKLNSTSKATAMHEFAHTLANTDADKYGLTDDADFWNEIKKIRRDYHRDVDKMGDTARWISTYEHSSKSVDEFFAEAFTHAKMREMGIDIPSKYGNDFTYSQRVLDVVDKYFGKSKKKR